MSSHRVVGRPMPRVDAHQKVTGGAQYCSDVRLPGMAHAHVVRSERAHADIVDVDTAAARSAEGVLAVFTQQDLAGLFPFYGHIITDHPVLAGDRVRFMGEPVALVVAESTRSAQRAAKLVSVQYEDLPVMISADEALAESALPIHRHTYKKGGGVFWETVPDDGSGDNIAHQREMSWGDVDTALAESHLTIETTASYPMLYAYAMEPYCAVASYANDTLEVISSTQHPYMVRGELARIFDMRLSTVTVRSPYVGGGYGSKSWTKVEPLASIASWYTGRPVKIALSVEEAMLTTRADAATVWVRSAFTEDGQILGREFDITLNTGAYADSSPSILDKAVHRCFGPYHIPNLAVRARLVYTNTVPASSYRGFGAPQTNAAGEYNVDRAASTLGIDPLEIRLRNMLERGEQVLPDRRPLDGDLKADIETLVTELGRPPEAQEGVRYGVGFGCSISDAGAYPASIATVKILSDGSALVSTGAVEIGQGSATVLSQIAAEELMLPFDSIRISQSDTANTPLERTTNASRTTTLVGLAVQRAGRDALDKLRSMAGEVWGCDSDEVSVADGRVLCESHSRDLSYQEIMDAWFGPGAGETIGVGVVRKTGATEAMPPFWEVGMAGVIVAVDEATGSVRIQKLVTVGDVGFAINPATTEGQDLGAATQGLGAALYEELVYEGGQLVNPNVVDYRIPRMTDLPAHISTLLAERGDGVGPYGAKGGGEGALNPIGGAVVSAVSRALDIWSDEVVLPLTPERVWNLLRGEGEM